jgi:hypothetical protein
MNPRTAIDNPAPLCRCRFAAFTKSLRQKSSTDGDEESQESSRALAALSLDHGQRQVPIRTAQRAEAAT